MLTEEQKKVHSQYPEHGKKIHEEIQGSNLVELEGVSHIPHLQEFEKFKEALYDLSLLLIFYKQHREAFSPTEHVSRYNILYQNFFLLRFYIKPLP